MQCCQLWFSTKLCCIRRKDLFYDQTSLPNIGCTLNLLLLRMNVSRKKAWLDEAPKDSIKQKNESGKLRAHNETERKLNLWDHKELEILHGCSVCLFFVQRVVQVLLLRCLLLSLPHQKKVYYGFWTHNCWWQFVVRSDHPKSFSTSIYNWKGNRTQAKCVYTIKHVTCNCRTFFCTINFQDFWGSNFHQIYFRTLAL